MGGGESGAGGSPRTAAVSPKSLSKWWNGGSRFVVSSVARADHRRRKSSPGLRTAKQQTQQASSLVLTALASPDSSTPASDHSLLPTLPAPCSAQTPAAPDAESRTSSPSRASAARRSSHLSSTPSTSLPNACILVSPTRAKKRKRLTCTPCNQAHESTSTHPQTSSLACGDVRAQEG